jgi:hypothetical protein
MSSFRTLARDHAITRGMLSHFVHMGFLARLKWLFMGL